MFYATCKMVHEKVAVGVNLRVLPFKAAFFKRANLQVRPYNIGINFLLCKSMFNP